MNRRISQLALGAALAVTLFGIVASSSLADTVVMGSRLTSNYDGGVSGGASTVSVQLSYDPATGTNPVVSPANGVITGWKVKSADDGAIYTLKVLRPNGAVSLVTATNSNFSGIASVQAPSAVPVGTSSPPRRARSSPIRHPFRSARATTSACSPGEPMTTCRRR